MLLLIASLLYFPFFLHHQASGFLSVDIPSSLPRKAITSSLQSTNDEEMLIDRVVHEEGVSLQQELRDTFFQRVRQAVGEETLVVLIGEGTHGTEEFYRFRNDLTKDLLQKGGFDAVICEGEVSAFQKLNRLVLPSSASSDASIGMASTSLKDAISGLFHDQFPEWMWSNDAMVEFVAWLREFNNNNRFEQQPVLLFGMDIHHLFQSMDNVIHYLIKKEEDSLLDMARHTYATLYGFRPEPKDYGKAIYYNTVPSQADAVSRVTRALEQETNKWYHDPHRNAALEAFCALENAHVVAASEVYYRQYYFPGHPTPWNLRDTAFLDTIQRVMSYLAQQKKKGTCEDEEPSSVRIVVWAHNSHIGDAHATGFFADTGQISLGRLCRQAFGKERVYLVGCLTRSGTVRAAHHEGGPGGIMWLRPTIEGSHEDLLHTISRRRGQNAFGYILRSNASTEQKVDVAAQELFRKERLERFVGSSYLPATEIQSHYSLCKLSEQFDFVLHIDQTTALRVD
jgi:erythromycin esterase-like protein